MIRIYERSSKSNRKPGWQKQAEEYQAWLKQVNSMSTNFSAKNRGPVKKKEEPKVTTSAGTSSAFPPKSFDAFKGGTKSVHRPDLLYADNPEMLERELKARERKFNVAPAYNKGGDVFVTEEELVAQLSTNKRRV